MDRYLILENGRIFKGKAFGYNSPVTAEIVFTTAMTGYMETLTDKSYQGQAVVQTFPLMGNYGVIEEDAEGDKPYVSAYIVREWCDRPSNFRCENQMDSYLKKHHITGLYGIDTRALTKVLRENGTMNGVITDVLTPECKAQAMAYRIEKAVEQVSVKKPQYISGEKIKEHKKAGYTVAMLDFGYKKNIVQSLTKRGCSVWLLPHDTAPETVATIKPDGIFLTNGPGNPKDCPKEIENLRQLFSMDIPMMGICLGHQLLALASGFKTQKLKYGHRGVNQPVKDMTTGRVYMSSQNHGYAVDNESIDDTVAKRWFVNVNDGTNEGLLYRNKPVMSVQFHPEACGGPKDTDFLFDRYIQILEAAKKGRGLLCH